MKINENSLDIIDKMISTFENLSEYLKQSYWIYKKKLISYNALWNYMKKLNKHYIKIDDIISYTIIIIFNSLHT